MGPKITLYKIFTVALLLVMVSVAKAEGPSVQCESSLIGLASTSSDTMKRLLTLLNQKSFINNSVLKKISESEKYFDFLEFAHFYGLFKNEMTYLAFQTVFKKIEKNNLDWKEIRSFAENLLGERTKKEEVVKIAKEESKSILSGKKESTVNIIATNQVSLFKHGGRWLGIVATGDAVIIFDYHTGEIEAKIPEIAVEDGKIQIVEDRGKVKAVFYSKHYSGIFISDITDLENIKTVSTPISYGAYSLLPLTHNDEQNILVYDSAHSDVRSMNIYNISKMTKKNPYILNGPKASTHQVFYENNKPFLAYGNEGGVIYYENILGDQKMRTFNIDKENLLDFKIIRSEGRSVIVSLTQESDLILTDLETGNNITKTTGGEGIAVSNYSKLYVFKHEGKDFVALFGVNTVSIYELPTLAFFKKYSRDKSIVAGFRGAGHEEMFSFEGKTYFVILLQGKVVVVNALTEEVIVEFKMLGDKLTVEKTDKGVIGSISVRGGQVFNVTLVGAP